MGSPTANARTFLATLGKAWRLRITYPTWLLNRLLSPLVWIAIAVYAYVGVADLGTIREAFASAAESPDFTGFLIVGQVIFTFFIGLNWRAGMAIERERWYGTFEVLLLAPMNRLAWLLGEAVFGVLDTGWTVFLALVAALFLFHVDLQVAHPGVAVLALLLTLAAMVALGLFFAGFYVLSRSAGPLAHSVQAPVRFFSGTQFPVGALPSALQAVSFALPVTYGLLVMRAVLLGNAGLQEVLPSLLVLAGFTVALTLAGWWMIDRMEKMAKDHGTLHRY